MNWIQVLVFTPAAVLAFVVAVKMYLKHQIRWCTSKRRLNGCVTLVTGATSGIGLETAKNFADRGARVIIGARNVEAAEKVAAAIRDETGNKNIVVKHLELSLMKSVRRFCAEVVREETRLDIMVNNAGVALTEKRVTEEGLETHYATNHLGPFLLTNLLMGVMARTPNPVRIVNVSSSASAWPKKLNLLNRNSAIEYDSPMIYPTTKLYNLLFTAHLHRLVTRSSDPSLKITVNAIHPGVVWTSLFRDAKTLILWRVLLTIGSAFFRTPWEGAQCMLHVALAEELEGVSGKYWDNCREALMNSLVTEETAEEFWRMSKQDSELQPDEDFFAKLKQ